MRHPALARLALVTAGTLASVVLLAAAELGLRALGLGAELRHDPLVGFSSLVPSFRLAQRADGTRVYRLASATRGSEAQEFLAGKPPGGFRIFAVGGSSANGVPYTAAEAFPRWLDRRLAAELPDVPVEVVNAATSGYGSRRIRVRVRELARYRPDLLIVYAGHNEVAERRFYANLIGMDPRLFRLEEWVASSHLYGLIAPWLGRGRAPSASLELHRGNRAVEMFAVPKSRPRDLAQIDSDFRANIEAVIRTMQAAGARVMLLAPSQNFADWAPGASFHRPDLTDAERAEWEAQVAAGERVAGRDCEAALRAWQRALGIDDRFAALHYEIAGCQRRLSRFADARESYRLASDLDGVPFGAPTRYGRVLRELATRYGTLFVDVDAILSRESPNGLVGSNFFVDALHPNLRTHQRIAQAVDDALYAAGIPAPRERWRRGAYADPDVAALYAARPELRKRERMLRAVTCLVAERRECALEQARAILRAEPDSRVGRQLLEAARQRPSD
jgi:lysophospholipase L1-like esterase